MSNGTASGRFGLAKKLALLLVPIVLVYAFLLVRSRGPVRFDRGVELVGASLPESAPIGATMPLDLQFRSPTPLSSDAWIFLHVETTSPSLGSVCRIVHDRPAPTGLTTGWTSADPVTHHLDVPIPSHCRPGTFRVYTGVWNVKEGDRLKLLDPASPDERLQIGELALLPAGSPPAEPRALSGSDVKLRARVALFEPWLGWIFGVLAASALAIVLARRVDEKPDAEPSTLPKVLRGIAFAVPAIILVLGILVVLEFVKDDAYISFRYAHNLVTGHGLVFNPGERLEGITNFLWTLILVPFEALGWDLFQVCEVLGTAISLGVIGVMLVLATRWDRPRKDLSFAWAATFLASSSSWVLWAKSGLEQALAAFLPLSSAMLLWRAQEGSLDENAKREEKRALVSGVLMGLGCLTRPEIHLIGVLVGAPLAFEAIARRAVPRRSLAWVVGVLAVTVPAHAFRFWYYGSLLPNTFYVKTSSGSVWRAGLDQLHEMFDFNHLGWVVLFVPFAFATRKRLVPKLVALSVSVAFMGYVVKVGVDEMQWFRLYLPALPFLLLLAGLGLRNLADAVASVLSRGRSPEPAQLLAGAVGWAAVLYAATLNFKFTHRELHGFDGHGDLAGTYHPDLGKFLVRHERPGGLVAFQDMGSTPYHAPDINFLDFIGLVDGTVARARHSYGLHAFVGGDHAGVKRKYDAEMREYYWKRNPEWAILTVYTPRDQEQAIAARFDRDPTPNAIGNAYANNGYQFGIWSDPRFQQSYVHVRTWQRSRGYYLSLFRRRDLWEQKPREVVLDAPPPDLTGPKVQLDRGIEVLGAKVDPVTHERHEVFITTWFKVPGPLEKDLTVFVHVTKPGFQAPYDHVPGDWMYPADRWEPGEIVEDRVLFQLPLNMKPGKYDVYVGLYRRSTGERVKILSGPNDGTGRIPVGSFEVKPLLPFVHQLIPPTRVEVMRKYPDRIPDHKRAPGT